MHSKETLKRTIHKKHLNVPFTRIIPNFKTLG